MVCYYLENSYAGFASMWDFHSSRRLLCLLIGCLLHSTRVLVLNPGYSPQSSSSHHGNHRPSVGPGPLPQPLSSVPLHPLTATFSAAATVTLLPLDMPSSFHACVPSPKPALKRCKRFPSPPAFPRSFLLRLPLPLPTRIHVLHKGSPEGGPEGGRVEPQPHGSEICSAPSTSGQT